MTDSIYRSWEKRKLTQKRARDQGRRGRPGAGPAEGSSCGAGGAGSRPGKATVPGTVQEAQPSLAMVGTSVTPDKGNKGSIWAGDPRGTVPRWTAAPVLHQSARAQGRQRPGLGTGCCLLEMQATVALSQMRSSHEPPKALPRQMSHQYPAGQNLPSASRKTNADFGFLHQGRSLPDEACEVAALMSSLSALETLQEEAASPR